MDVRGHDQARQGELSGTHADDCEEALAITDAARQGKRSDGAQFEVGVRLRGGVGHAPAHAVAPWWASALPQRGALARRAVEAGRAERDAVPWRRDRVRKRDREVWSRITRAGALVQAKDYSPASILNANRKNNVRYFGIEGEARNVQRVIHARARSVRAA